MKYVGEQEMEISMTYQFERLLLLLGKKATDPELFELIKGQPEQIRRIGSQGYLAFKEDGVSAVFKDVRQGGVAENPEFLLLSGFHFHRKGHDGYEQYRGAFPSEIDFNDTEQTIQAKLGPSESKGGGGISKILKKPIPHWVRYFYKNGALTLQFDSQGLVEMVSLFDPNLHPSALIRQN